MLKKDFYSSLICHSVSIVIASITHSLYKDLTEQYILFFNITLNVKSYAINLIWIIYCYYYHYYYYLNIKQSCIFIYSTKAQTSTTIICPKTSFNLTSHFPPNTFAYWITTCSLFHCFLTSKSLWVPSYPLFKAHFSANFSWSLLPSLQK